MLNSQMPDQQTKTVLNFGSVEPNRKSKEPRPFSAAN